MAHAMREGTVKSVLWLTLVLGILLAHVGVVCAEENKFDNSTSAQSKFILFQKAIITAKDINTAIDIEKNLKDHYEKLSPQSEQWYCILKGNSHVLIVAGHSTSHIREGKVLQADSGTGSMAVMLNQLTGATVIYATYQSPSDPNYYNNNGFKESLAQLLSEVHPTIVLDLHASDWNRPYDIDFGTLQGVSLRGKKELFELLVKRLEYEGLKNFSQDYFSASQNNTVTKWVYSHNVPCIQIEINSTWIMPGENGLYSQRYSQLLEGLVRFINDVK